jgi:hypothetical protein
VIAVRGKRPHEMSWSLTARDGRGVSTTLWFSEYPGSKLGTETGCTEGVLILFISFSKKLADRTSK